MKQKKSIIVLSAVCLLFLFAYSASALSLPKWFPFNKKEALDDWQEKIFKNRVLYSVKSLQGDGFLLAKSNQACSGLIYKIKFNARKNPMISWKWNVIQFPDKKVRHQIDEGWLEKDDYAARVYIIFPSWNFMNIKAIEYIWAENIAEGTVLTSPYYKNIRLIVVESGKHNMGRWVPEERNIYEDYERAYGRKPLSLRVGAVALMTDSDNTLSSAEATYKDLKVGYTND